MKKSFIVVLAAVFAVCFLGCKAQIESHEHTFSTDWSFDDNHHWHEATCEHKTEKFNKAKHLFGDWNDGERKCTVCGYKDSCEHQYSDWINSERKCSVCGYKETCEHNFSEWIIKKSSTEDTYEKEKTCFICEHRVSEEAEKEVCTYHTDHGTIIEEVVVEGIKMKSTYYNDDDSINYINEYDSIGNKIKFDSYKDGKIDYTEEFNTNGLVKKYTKYLLDGSVAYCYEASEGNHVYSVSPSSDGSKTIVKESSDKTYEPVKVTIYDSDLSIILQNEASEGNYIKDSYKDTETSFEITEFNSNDDYVKITAYTPEFSIICYVTYEYYDNGKIKKFTKYNSDGTLYYINEYNIDKEWATTKYTRYLTDGSFFQYEAEAGNYIIPVDDNTDEVLSLIIEYNSNGKVKEIFFNPDYSIDYIFEYQNNNDEPSKFLKFNPDGSIYLQYEAADGNYIKLDYWIKPDEELSEDGEYNLYVGNIKEYNNNGKTVKYTDYSYDGIVLSVTDYDINEIITKTTGYYSNGTVKTITEYNSSNQASSYFIYNPDETLFLQYKVSDGNYIYVQHNADNSIEYISEKNSNDKDVKRTYYNSDGSVYVHHQAADGNYIDSVYSNYSTGKIEYITEYNSDNKQAKCTYYKSSGLKNYSFGFDSTGKKHKSFVKYNPDGSLLIEYEAEEGNYLYQKGIIKADGTYMLQERDSTGKTVKTTYYNSDGSLKEVITN